MKKLFIALLLAASFTANAEKHRCAAITQAKTQCTRNAVEGATTCKQHSPDTPRCGAKNLDGTSCKRSVKVAGQHCKPHQ